MRTKLFYLTSFLLSTVLVLFVLSSCDTGAVDSVISDTEMTQAETERESEIQPEDIVYHEEEFPVVYISTADGFQVTSKTEYTECNVRIELNDRYSAYTSTYTDEDGGGALIRCRGNMSYRLEDMKAKNKYSYKIKLDKKANVLGMGKSKHWILVNSWRDPGYQRNKASYDYSAMLGLDHVDSQWVSVYYNGEYRGVYLLCETIRVADDRIEMSNWEEFAEDIAEKYAEDHGFSDELEQLLSDGMEDNLEWITTYKYTFTYDGESEIIDLSKYYDKDKLDFTSGYLIESCQGALGSETVNWTTKHNVPISVDSPSRLTNPEMLDYVRTLIQDFEDALFSPTFYNAKEKHYSEYVDVDSMVDYWLVWNYFLNTEFSVRSLFFYIYDGKIIWGPCWDFDATAGSVMTMSAAKAKTDYWLHDRNSAWWLEIFGDPWFTSLCQERWYEMRELNDVFLQTFDIYYDYIAEEAQRGYEYDGERSLKVNQPLVNNGHSLDPEQDYLLMYRWFRDRIDWLNESFAKVDANIDSSGNTRSDKIFYLIEQNGLTLRADTSTVYGVKADYMLSSESGSDLIMTLSTTHSAVDHIEVYLNGSTHIGKASVSSGRAAKVNISPALLDRSEGALNVLYLIAFRGNGTVRSVSSVYIRSSDIPMLSPNECIVEFGDEKIVVERGDSVIVPDYPYKRDGYAICGWTQTYDTDEVYKPGDVITVNSSKSFYIRFKPIDMCSEFVLDKVIYNE